MLLAALAGLVAPLGARAQSIPPATAGAATSPGAPDPEVTSAYRELVDRALDEFKHKNWQEARVLFRRAHELSPNARTLRGLGIVSYEMRDYVQAIMALSDALVETRQPLTDAQRRECETLRARSRTFVGSYVLSLEPAHAEVKLDGRPLVRDREGRVLVAFGEHTLHVTAPGYQESNSRMVVQGGEQGELKIVLYRPTSVVAAPASKVEKNVDVPPAPVPPAAPRAEGSRFVGGGLRYTWVALGASAAFGGAFAGAWFVGQQKVDDLEAQCDDMRRAGVPCRRGEVDTAEVQRFERLSNAMLGLTAGALVTTIVLASLEWPRERALAVGVSGVPGSQLSLRGSF